jgi:hypothetical protein
MREITNFFPMFCLPFVCLIDAELWKVVANMWHNIPAYDWIFNFIYKDIVN